MVKRVYSKILISSAKFYKSVKTKNPYAASVSVIAMFFSLIFGFIFYFFVLLIIGFRQVNVIELILIMLVLGGTWLYFEIKNKTKRRLFYHYRNYRK